MEPDNTFTRRVCAVLLADVTGYSALMGQDDERAARAVQNLHAVMQGIVSECGGHAEPVAGDALFATFDSVVAAVTAALQIQQRIAAEEFAGTRLQTRIGVHFGDVLVREGRAFGDAINIAARLQTLAKPGTVCISDGVHRHVRSKLDERFVDLGKQRLKNISDPVHAYLIVPREGGPSRVRRWRARPLLWGGGVAALVVAAGAIVVTKNVTTMRAADAPAGRAAVGPVPKQVVPVNAEPGQSPPQVALGVMVFKSHGDGGQDWEREALRDGLNAQLSQLSGVKVYSKEFIDFLTTRQGLSEIEAATKLGISKMLSGSVVTVGDTVRVETHVVDVTSGVLEASYTTEVSKQNFAGLQKKLTFEVIARLNLPITADEKQTLLAQKDTDLNAAQLLLEAEGAAAAKPPGPATLGFRSSQLVQRVQALWRIPAALADDAADQAAIRTVLEQLRQVTQARQLDALAALYTQFPPEQQAAQQRYFENVQDLKVVIDDIDVAVIGDEAVASYTRTDDFVDNKTGRPMHVTVRLTKTLRKQEGAWKLAAK